MIFKKNKTFALCLGLLLSGFLLYGQTEESVKILTQTGPGIISLTVYGKDKQEIAKGTAIVIAEDVAATSYHLISQGVSCGGFNIKMKGVDVEGVLAVDKNLDLALIKIDGKVKPLPTGNFEALTAGKKFFAVGAKESGEIIVIDGTFRNFFDLGAGRKVADSTISVPDTFSGGAVVGDDGKAQGIFQVVEKRLRFIVSVDAATALLKTQKLTLFKSWQPEDYLSTLEGAWLTGRLYFLMREFYNAQKSLEKVTGGQPNNLEAWAMLAKVYDDQRDYQSALTAYKKITELDPGRDDAYFNMGKIHVRMQDSAAAIAALEKALELNPDNKEAVLALGDAYDGAREFRRAGDAYDKYISLKPENAGMIYQRLGQARMNANQFEEAIAAFVEALKTQPDNQTLNFSLSQAYQKAKKLDKAEEIYKNLVRLSPGDALNYYKYILMMYSDANMPDKAVEAAKKVVEITPKDEQANYNLGYMYQQMQKYPEAIAAFKQAIALNPRYDIAYFSLGLCLYFQKNYAAAIEPLKKDVEIVPDHMYGWLYIAMSYMQLKNFGAALDPAKKAVDLQPENATALYNLAIVYLNLKDRYSAAEIQKKLQAIDPGLAAKLKGYIK